MFTNARNLNVSRATFTRQDLELEEACYTAFYNFVVGRNTEATGRQYLATIAYFRKLSAMPIGEWDSTTYEAIRAQRLADGLRPTTLHTNEHAIEHFTRFLSNPDYPWRALFEARYGHPPRIIVHDLNRMLKVEALESGSDVRQATRNEIWRLFRTMLTDLDQLAMIDSPSALLAYRDYMALAISYCFGTRRSETVKIAAYDWLTNPHRLDLKSYGALVVRNGKSKPHGPKRRRTVFLVQNFAWIGPELEQYEHAIRPLFNRGPRQQFFVNQLGNVLTADTLTRSFADWRDKAGLDPVLTLHSLRRSFVTHSLEDGWGGRFVSEQVGHDNESTTAIYTFLDDDYRQRAMLDAQRRILTVAP